MTHTHVFAAWIRGHRPPHTEIYEAFSKWRKSHPNANTCKISPSDHAALLDWFRDRMAFILQDPQGNANLMLLVDKCVGEVIKKIKAQNEPA